MIPPERQPLQEDYFFYDQAPETRRQVQPATTTITRVEGTKTANNNTTTTQTVTTTKKAADYNFYDGDIEDIHTGELYQYNDSPARFGLLAGGLALLAGLVVVGLTGVIYHRDLGNFCTSIPLAHLIIACVAVVAAALGAFVCLQSRQAMTRHQELNHLLIGLSLVLALIFFCYFLASGVFIFMYRPVHYSNLISMKNQGQPWNDKFGDTWSFEDGWGEDRRILWWVAFFSLVAALGFLLLAISLWLLAKFPVQLARIILGVACLAGVLLVLFGIDQLAHARKILGNNYVLKNTEFDFLNTLLVLLAIAGILLFINAIWNLFKRRSGHFLFGTLFIIFVFIFVCFLGLVLRDLRKNQFGNISNQSTYCRDLLDSYHQDDIKDFCPNKYLAAGASCSKSYMASAWETDKAFRFVNPACCNAANSFSLCPLYVAGILSLILVVTILVVIATNYYLSDRSEYLEFADKKFGIFELLFVIGIILAIIAFGFWWGFKPADFIPRQNNSHPQAIRDTFGEIKDYRDPNFTPVDLNKIYQGNVPPSVYIQGAMRNVDTQNDATLAKPATRLSTANNVVNFAVNPANCANLNTCGFRAGILAVNGKFDVYTGNSVLGTLAARPVFFNDSNKNNDFLFIYGKAEELNAFVKLLRFVPIDINKESRLVVNAEQIDLSSVSANGLRTDETPAAVSLTPDGTIFSDFSGYQVQNISDRTCFYDNSCASELKCFADSDFSSSKVCKRAFVFYASDGVINVSIPVRVLNTDGKKVAYNEDSLASNSFYVHESTKYLLSDVSLSGGAAKFKLPNPVHGNIFVNLDLVDKADHYLPYAKSFVVPPTKSGVFENGEILLLTKDGKGCIGAADLNACFANKAVQFGRVEVHVLDSDSGEAVSDLAIQLLAGINGERLLASKNSDGSGKAIFENVAFDYYTFKFPGDLFYFPARTSFKLQTGNDAVNTLFVRNRKSDTILLEQFVNNSDAVDQDFVVSVASDQGAQCKIAPYNKYCAYGEHLVDVRVAEEGFEKIRLSKFAVAHYLGYWENSAAYTGTCGANDLSNFRYYTDGAATIRSLAFDWKKTRRLDGANYQLLYCFTGWGLNSIKYQNRAAATEPSATECAGLYPSGSEYSVAKLRALVEA